MLENSDKFYCQELNNYKSKSLVKDLQTIFEMNYSNQIFDQQTIKITECVSNSKMSLEFSKTFQSKLSEFQQLLKTEISELKKLTESTTNKLTLMEIFDFSNFFTTLEKRIKCLTEAINGSQLLDDETQNFLLLINQNSEKNHIFEHFNIMLKKSFKFRQFASQDSKWHCINPEIFFNYKRVLTMCIYETYNSESRLRKTTQSTSEKFFLLQVVENTPIDLNEGLIIENMNIANANYEIMSKSFQSMPKKCVNNLNLVKIKPLLEEERQLYKPNSEGETYKYVPFVDISTYEVICVFCIKFWQSMSSSLSNTINQNEEILKANKTHIKDDDNDSINHSSTSNISIPFYSPIYFYIQNASDHKYPYYQDFNELFKDD